ncbi:MerR family transcriptional regulator [Janibacter sp. G1551]|uniref:transcriptional regulator FtsR n=1 Tax=Janibacter sp. G1551 TaxID=3420440 RepID=UPI003D0676C2
MPAESRGSTLTIGAVLELLREDFPEVTISKLRYLESEGLVTPERSPKGYRRFSAADVARLGYVLRAQRDHFLPLKVIRARLDEADRGVAPLDLADPVGVGESSAPATVPDDTSPDEGGPATGSGRGSAASGDLLPPVAADGLRLTQRELRQRAGLAPEDFQHLITYGLVRPDAEGYYGANALAAASAAAALMASGLEARHLRPFRTAADREVSLAGHVLAQRQFGPRSRLAANATPAVSDADVLEEVLRQCLALHVALVREELRDAD